MELDLFTPRDRSNQEAGSVTGRGRSLLWYCWRLKRWCLRWPVVRSWGRHGSQPDGGPGRFGEFILGMELTDGLCTGRGWQDRIVRARRNRWPGADIVLWRIGTRIRKVRRNRRLAPILTTYACLDRGTQFSRPGIKPRKITSSLMSAPRREGRPLWAKRT